MSKTRDFPDKDLSGPRREFRYAVTRGVIEAPSVTHAPPAIGIGASTLEARRGVPGGSPAGIATLALCVAARYMSGNFPDIWR